MTSAVETAKEEDSQKLSIETLQAQEKNLDQLRKQVEEKQSRLKEKADTLTLAEETLIKDKNEWNIQCAQRQ